MVAINTSKKITTAATPVTAVKTPVTTNVKSVAAPPVKAASAVSQAVQGVKAAMTPATPTTPTTPVKAPPTAAGAGVQAVNAVKNASTLAPNFNENNTSYFSKYFGGSNKYVADQLARYQGAVASGDIGLQDRLKADAQRVGYQLPQQGTDTTGTGVADTGTTVTATQLTPEDRQRGYTSVNGKIMIINPDGSLRGVLNQADNEYVSKLIEADANRQNELNTLNMGQLQNQQTYDYATGKLVGQEAVDKQGAQELQNRRGGFYSGGLDYQLGAINSSYADQFGQLAQQYQARNQQLQSAYGTNINTINKTINALMQAEPGIISEKLAAAADKKRQDAIDLGKTTGTIYLPEAQEAYSQLLTLKQRAETPGITAAERASLSSQADVLRGKLSGLGVDVSQLGASSNLKTAAGQNVGIKTYENERDTLDRNYDKNKDSIANGWKQAETLGTIPKSLANALGDPSLAGKETMAAKELVWDHLWTQADKLGVVPDQLADLIGVERGTQTQAAYEFAQNLALDEDAAELDWMQEGRLQSESGVGGSTKKSVTPTAAAKILNNSLSKIVGYTRDENDNLTIPKYGAITDPQQRADKFLQVMQTVGPMAAADVVSMLASAKYSDAEIRDLKNTYPEFFEGK